MEAQLFPQKYVDEMIKEAEDKLKQEAIKQIRHYWEKGETKKGYALFDFFNIQVDELK